MCLTAYPFHSAIRTSVFPFSLAGTEASGTGDNETSSYACCYNGCVTTCTKKLEPPIGKNWTPAPRFGDHHHKRQGLDPLIRSVSRVTAARANASLVFQFFSFLVVCSGMISKGFGFVAFFASVKASSVYSSILSSMPVICSSWRSVLCFLWRF